MRWGAALGLILVAWVLVLVPLGGADALDRLGIHLFQLAFLYLLAGVLGGALVGCLLPLTRWAPGAVLVAVIALFPMGLGAVGLLRGFRPWTVVHTITVVSWPVIVGIPVGLAYRAMYRTDISLAMRWRKGRARVEQEE
jgi:hypothetical protein